MSGSLYKDDSKQDINALELAVRMVTKERDKAANFIQERTVCQDFALL